MQNPKVGSTTYKARSKMKIPSLLLSSLLLLLVPHLLGLTATSEAKTSSSRNSDFDFFYFVIQWPGSYCDTRRGCCYPTSGEPAADFGIHGLWPNNNDGTYPQSCGHGGADSKFDPSELEDVTEEMEIRWPTLSCPSNDGLKFWSHEWSKHGTCSGLGQAAYFRAALGLHRRAGVLASLEAAGIVPDGSDYSVSSIVEAIAGGGAGHAPGVECNADEGRRKQLYQVYLCVDKSAAEFIDCPVFPNSRCPSRVEFPPFGDDEDAGASTSDNKDEL